MTYRKPHDKERTLSIAEGKALTEGTQISDALGHKVAAIIEAVNKEAEYSAGPGETAKIANSIARGLREACQSREKKPQRFSAKINIESKIPSEFPPVIANAIRERVLDQYTDWEF